MRIKGAAKPAAVAFFLCYAGAAALAGQAPPPAAAPPGPNPARFMPRFTEVAILLAPHPDGGRITETVRAGQSVIVRLWTRPSARALRIEARVGDRPATRHELPALATPLPRPTELGPECETAFAALQAIAESRTVGDADRAERTSESLSRRVACPQLGQATMTVYGHSRVRIPGEWPLSAGETLRLDVETVEPDGRKPTRWEIAVSAESPARAWRHASEEEWLASAIVRDVIGFLWHAAGSRTAAPAATVRLLRRAESGPSVLKVEFPPGKGAPFSGEITLEPNVFAPAVYDAVARGIADRLGQRATRSSAPEGLVDALTQLSAATLVRESQRVGAALTRTPLDAAAHDEAALLHLTLALREAAGDFTDLRPALARATAHLVMSRLAAAPGNACGRTADNALLVLTGRHADVMPRLKTAMAAPSPRAERAWARALMLRATDDWRLVAADERPTRLERLHLYRARRAAMGGLLALDMFKGADVEPAPDWAWIALEGAATVQEGNMFAEIAFPLTLAELSEVLDVSPPPAPESVAAAIRPEETASAVTWSAGKAAVAVLDRSMWSGFLARQLLHSANAADHHLRRMLGTPDDADAYAKRVEPYLKDTPWPLALEPLQRARERTVRYRPLSCAAFSKWAQSRPEAIPAKAWSEYPGSCVETQSELVAALKDWFAGPALPGTVVGLRERRATLLGRLTPALAQRLHAAAPYNEQVANVVLDHAGKSNDAAAIAQTFAARKEYTLSVAKRIAGAAEEGPERRKALERLCDMSADECGPLAAHLYGAGDPEGAARTWERLLAEARDRVGASNTMQWLAAYYLETGRPQDAERVAREAGEVYSGAGLELLGTVLERLGRLAEAEKTFKEIETRYNNRRALDSFYIRAQRLPGGEGYEDAARRAMERFFPAGLERVALPDFKNPPTDGARITEDSGGSRRLGLAKGDVVVALDGYRLRTVQQYDLLRGLQRGQKVSLIAWSWQRGSYVTVEGSFVDRRVGYQLEDYRGTR